MSDRNIVWLIFIILIIERFVETVLPDKIKQKGKISSKWLFYCILFTGIFVYIIATMEFIFIVKKINIIITIIGVLFIILRIILKVWVIKSMGKYWSIQIEIRDDHKLITNGPYRYMRHPSYASTMIEATAGALILNAYYTLFFVWSVYFPFVLIRIYLEEKELIRKFGKEYEDYKRKVSMHFPFKKTKIL